MIAKNNSLYSVEDTFDAPEDKNYGADNTFARGNLNDSGVDRSLVATEDKNYEADNTLARGDLSDSVVDRSLVAVDRPYTATEQP